MKEFILSVSIFFLISTLMVSLLYGKTEGLWIYVLTGWASMVLSRELAKIILKYNQ